MMTPPTMKVSLVSLVVLASSGCSLYFNDRADPDVGVPDPGQPVPLPLPTTPPPPPVPTVPPPLPIPDKPCDGGAPTSCTGHAVDVFSVYETRSDHSFDYHPVGTGNVTITAPEAHTLVLVSYEPTHWSVSAIPGATIDTIYLLGYHAQSVDIADRNVRIVPLSFEQGGPALCGISYPYGGDGCDTNALLAFIEGLAGPVNNFHGCYRATSWTLLPGGTATSNCETGVQDDLVLVCPGTVPPPPPPPTHADWKPLAFETYDVPSCTGDRFVRFDEHYGMWVGAILCGSADLYKLYMSTSPDAAFLQIADFAGHGQDHCELVNPAFALPDEDDITSGGCTDCSVAEPIDIVGVPVYARAAFGEAFVRVISKDWADLTTSSYACGVAIP
jgi:hypothetical protein